MKKFAAIVIAVCSSAAHADPLAEFQSIVARCKEAYAAQPIAIVAFSEQKNSWGRYITRTQGVSYDVRKTDSLVAPLAAHIEIIQGNDAGFAPTEDEAKALNIDLDGLRDQFVQRLRFTFRENSWQLIDGHVTLSSRSAKGKPFRADFSDKRSRDYLLSRPKTSPLAACLGTVND